MTSCLVMGKIMETVLDDVDSSQLVLASTCHRILNIRKQYMNDVIT